MIYPTFHPTALYAGDFPRATRSITIASGANAAGAPLKRGTVLGRITASDKYVVSVATANDGSQVPATILPFDVDASAADVAAKGYFTGEYAGEVAIFDASWTIATLEAAFRKAGSSMFIRSVGAVA